MGGSVIDIFILAQDAIFEAVAAAEGERARFIACQFIAASYIEDLVVEGGYGLAVLAYSIF